MLVLSELIFSLGLSTNFSVFAIILQLHNILKEFILQLKTDNHKKNLQLKQQVQLLYFTWKYKSYNFDPEINASKRQVYRCFEIIDCSKPRSSLLESLEKPSYLKEFLNDEFQHFILPIPINPLTAS